MVLQLSGHRTSCEVQACQVHVASMAGEKFLKFNVDACATVGQLREALDKNPRCLRADLVIKSTTTILLDDAQLLTDVLRFIESESYDGEEADAERMSKKMRLT